MDWNETIQGPVKESADNILAIVFTWKLKNRERHVPINLQPVHIDFGWLIEYISKSYFRLAFTTSLSPRHDSTTGKTVPAGYIGFGSRKKLAAGQAI